jgi:FkbM family methyltransferase
MVARYPDGRAFRVPAGDTMYARVFVFGAYEPAETAVVRCLLRRGDFAVDIGANHGWFSLVMASVVQPHGVVWAVEPAGLALDALTANLALNPDLPVEVQPVALGDHDGAVEIHTFAGLPHGHASTSPLGRSDWVAQSVPQVTVDRLLDEGPGVPVLVKLDVEGAELSVLRGAAELLGADPPPIWMMEVNYETAGAFDYEPRDLLSPLPEHGRYTTYRVTDSGLRLEDDPSAAPHGATWICVPDQHMDRARSLVVPADGHPFRSPSSAAC